MGANHLCVSCYSVSLLTCQMIYITIEKQLLAMYDYKTHLQCIV